jgi:ELWxxDGT repeat protein
VVDILPGPEGSNPTSIVVHDGTLYFTADDGVSGRELWASDGTAAGTQLVEDLCPGPADCLWEEQLLFDSRVLHSAASGLMIVIGPAAALDGLAVLPDGATSIVELTVDPDTWGGFPTLGDAAVFSACDPYPDCGLWRSDGTATGTYSLYQVPPGPTNDMGWVLGVAGGWAYFPVFIDGILELWRSAGTAGTAERVEVLGSGSAFDGTMPRGVALGERLFFGAADAVSGLEPWVTDGTADGTFLLADVFPGELGSLSWYVPQRLVSAAGEVAFFAMHPDDDWALWASDLTTAGTGRVADLDQQVSGVPTALLLGSNLRAGPFGGRLIFGADDEETGIEPWITDGSEAGTELLADVAPGSSSPGYQNSSYPVAILADGGLAAITSNSGLWVTDGTPAGTIELDSGLAENKLFTKPSQTPAHATEIFVAGSALSVTDGTPGGTVGLEGGLDYLGRALVSQETIFIARFEPPTGYELWSTSGEPNAADLLRDIYPGADSSYPELLGVVSGSVLFGADDGINGRELWTSDGTEKGTTLLLDIDPSGEGDPQLGGPDHPPAILAGRLYFTAEDATSGRELWASDGTAEGTSRVADINLGAAPSDPSEMVVAGEQVFFFANDGLHGRELWVAGGSDNPPHLVKDINPGSASATPIQRMGRRILAVGSRVYFAAHGGAEGAELWTSDGTFRGTRRVQDINPGPGSSSPSNFVVAGDCLYFSANDGTTGFELWALPLGPRLSSNDRRCAPSRPTNAGVLRSPRR